jgi:hypothetical protein
MLVFLGENCSRGWAFRNCLLLLRNTHREPSERRPRHGDMRMTAEATKLQAAENELKQLMADVARAMEQAQEAVARIAGKAADATANANPPTLSS